MRTATLGSSHARAIRLLITALIGLLTISASARQSDAMSDEKVAAQLLTAARAHLRVPKLDRQESDLRGLRQIYYDEQGGGRFATFLFSPDGQLVEFHVNSPDGESYEPIRKRLQFIGKMMEIASPRTSAAERDWGARQLDIVWTAHTPALPVRIGSYVYQGNRANNHDHFSITASSRGIDGLRFEYRKRVSR